MTFSLDLASDIHQNIDDQHHNREDQVRICKSSFDSLLRNQFSVDECLNCLDHDHLCVATSKRIKSMLQNYKTCGKVLDHDELDTISQDLCKSITSSTRPWVRWRVCSKSLKSFSNRPQDSKVSSAPWFNSICSKFKIRWRRLQRSVKVGKQISSSELERLLQAKRDYCRIRKSTRRQFERGQGGELDRLKKLDSSQLWKKLNPKVKPRDVRIPIHQISEHFAKLNEHGFPYDVEHIDQVATHTKAYLQQASPLSFAELMALPMPADIWKNKHGKAAGADGWTPQFLDLVLSIVKYPFESLFRSCFWIRAEHLE